MQVINDGSSELWVLYGRQNGRCKVLFEFLNEKIGRWILAYRICCCLSGLPLSLECSTYFWQTFIRLLAMHCCPGNREGKSL